MPVIKVGDKWEFGGNEYDTEEKAESAYKATIALKFGVPEEDKTKKSKKSAKKKSKKAEEDDEDAS